MKFDQADIEAVASARVTRTDKSQTTKWSITALVLIVVGFAVAWQYSTMIGYLVVAAGAVVMIWRLNVIGKKQKAYKEVLVREWRAENKSEVK